MLAALAAAGRARGLGRLSALYPLVVDCGAAASCAAWLHTWPATAGDDMVPSRGVDRTEWHHALSRVHPRRAVVATGRRGGRCTAEGIGSDCSSGCRHGET